MTRPTRQQWTWLAAVVAVAVACRVVGADRGLWIDEVYSLLRSFRLPLLDTVTVFPNDNHHPLYSALARIAVLLFGESAWAIRLPSLVAGVAMVPATYALGRRYGSHREALLAALLLATSYHHVWFSQNARGYMLMALFATVGALVLLDMLERPAARHVALYALVAALGAWTHLTMVFVVIGQAVGIGLALLLRRAAAAALRRFAAAFILAGVATLVLYAPMLGDVITFFTTRESNLKGISTPGWALAEAWRVLAAGFGAGSATLGSFVIGCAVALFAVGVASLARRALPAILVFLAPVAVIFAGAAVARGTFYPRFLFALVAFGVLIGVRGVLSVSGWIEARLRGTDTGRLGAVAIGAAAALSLATVIATARLPKQDFEGAARYAVSSAGGATVAAAGAAVVPLRDWLGVPVAEVDSTGSLEMLRRRGPVVLVYTFPRYLASSAPDVHAAAAAGCRGARVFPGSVGDGAVTVCRLERTP